MTPDEGKDTATRREVLKGDTEATSAARTPQNESAPQHGTTAKNEAERTEAGRTEGTEVRGDERSRGRETADTHRDTPDRTAGPGERGTAARTPSPRPPVRLRPRPARPRTNTVRHRTGPHPPPASTP
ncbi:hypothetical protein ACFQ51_13245 [Streptomyces kaempferi]